MPEVELLVLASSRKPGGRCIAGYDLEGDRWIRPVSERISGTLGLEHCAIDGEWPEVLDVVRVDLSDHRPQPWQPENWRISGVAWHLVEQVGPSEALNVLEGIIDHEVRILNGTQRSIPADALRNNPIDASLTLVRPTELRWRIENAPWGRQEKAFFTVDSPGHYDLHVTDFPIEAALHQLPIGIHDRSAVGIADEDEVLLTLSLTEPYERNDECYKLAAAVIALPEE